METLSLHPDAIKFGAVECCVLHQAGAKEVHQPLIQQCLAETDKVFSAALFGIFKHTLGLVFIPNAFDRKVYARVAAAEKNILIEKLKEKMFECGHSASEHWKALDNVVYLMLMEKNPYMPSRKMPY